MFRTISKAKIYIQDNAVSATSCTTKQNSTTMRSRRVPIVASCPLYYDVHRAAPRTLSIFSLAAIFVGVVPPAAAPKSLPQQELLVERVRCEFRLVHLTKKQAKSAKTKKQNG